VNSIDLLVVGSGISGLSAAIKAKELGSNVVVATKSILTKNNSVMAQGGINIALGNVESDSVEAHIADTLNSAKGLADENMVQKLCSNGIQSAEFLEQIAVPFSRLNGAKTPLKSIAQRKLGGASAKRACYAQDYTGLKILHSLLDTAIAKEIPLLQNMQLLELLKNSSGEICGGLFLNISSGELEPIYAKRTLIATGGFGALYSKHTNSANTTGDGIAAILRAGGVLSDLEFVQFHPTTLKGRNILISESARGEGGLLLNSDNERFIDELGTRDKVAMAIFQQLQSGKSVYLDMRHIGKEKLQHLMPQELKLIKQYAKVDASEELVEIEPAVHYTMGGALVDEHFKVVGLKGCFAAGEASNARVHGANRLGGNSLLEAVTFGLLSAQEALESTPVVIEESAITYTLPLKSGSNNFAITEAKNALSQILFENVGILKDSKGLAQAKEQIEALVIDKLTIDDSAKESPLLVKLLELQNQHLLALALIESSLWRTESRGAHQRADFTEPSKEFEKSSTITLKELQL
jgi:succinate dehydrogenase/fumarate reductase flavoprotein subunit